MSDIIDINDMIWYMYLFAYSYKYTIPRRDDEIKQSANSIYCIYDFANTVKY